MSGKQRADLGFGAALEDLSGFGTGLGPAPRPRPAQDEVAQAAAAAGFLSREPVPPVAPPAAAPVPRTQLRRRRTGRTAQFNIKTRPETIEAFCQIADARGWGLGETLEHAVRLLQAETPER